MKHPIIAIIGFIASLITIFVFFTGKDSLFGGHSIPSKTENPLSSLELLYNDQTSGLAWQRYDSGVLRTLGEAYQYCESLSIGNKTFRLPTAGELISIGDVRSTFQYIAIDNTGVLLLVGVLAGMAGLFFREGKPEVGVAFCVIALIAFPVYSDRKPNVNHKKVVAKNKIYWALGGNGNAVDFGSRTISVVTKDNSGLHGVICVSEL